MSIRISEKHGVNPSIMVCPFCFQSMGVALMGRLEFDREAPRQIVGDELCRECVEYMKQGFLIRERNGDFMTGRMWVIKKDAAADMWGEEVAQRGLAYIDEETAKKIGLPYNEGEENAESE